MTCKCGSSFCYTCGAKWRSCNCTETDEIKRQAELRRRRGEREATMDAEAAELARIIAQIEEMERRDARERQREDERRTAERRREEAELARLEEQRIREEDSRRFKEECMEQEFRDALRMSVEESCHMLQQAWTRTHNLQRRALDDRHLHAERRHFQDRDGAAHRQEQENEQILTKLQSNIDKRRKTLEQKHKLDLNTFTTGQEEGEDDLSLETQKDLRGKPDTEARGRLLREQSQKQREEKHQELLTRHKSELEALQENAKIEIGGLRLANESKTARLEHESRLEFDILLRDVAADRAWFDFLAERRQNMITADERLMFEALEAEQDPLGLTEEAAMTIGPFLPDILPGTRTTELRTF